MSNYLIHYGTPGMHWGDRKYQYEDGSLTPAGRERYLKGAREETQRQFAQNIGSTSTLARQQKRYLRWARTHEDRARNTDKTKRGEYAKAETLARRAEAKLYSAGLKKTFAMMKQYRDKKLPSHYYNEDAIAQVWNEEYRRQVIEPAWQVYNKAVTKARQTNQNDEDFVKFASNKTYMERYGYSSSVEAEEMQLDMARMAYANYLIDKDKYD